MHVRPVFCSCKFCKTPYITAYYDAFHTVSLKEVVAVNLEETDGITNVVINEL